ncbi:hypothetical protein QAD02_005882 [Eretmocerus hayati]|uniref:Uncharacterized protein n=1 Tax=Eretmocerus hayati TaxID=131215 RepID=A0ACC2MZH8_9HYME|nr:hypothetical protein QAD02_005882 [Eretmocerus hayati]
MGWEPGLWIREPMFWGPNPGYGVEHGFNNRIWGSLIRVMGWGPGLWIREPMFWGPNPGYGVEHGFNNRIWGSQIRFMGWETGLWIREPMFLGPNPGYGLETWVIGSKPGIFELEMVQNSAGNLVQESKTRVTD